MPHTLRIGTSGYSYADWKGLFYPEACRQNEMLSYYAERFNTVELNFSYYAQPSASTLERMIEKRRSISASPSRRTRA